MVGTFPLSARIVNYLQPQTITLISYNVINNPTTTFRNGASSAFEIASGWSQTPTGKGGYFTTVSVKPKGSLPRNSYTDVLTIRGQNQGNNFSVDVQLSYIETRGEQSVLSIDIVPNKTFSDENFFLTTKGGSGKGTVTFTKVSGNANINKQTGEVEITGVGDIQILSLPKCSGIRILTILNGYIPVPFRVLHLSFRVSTTATDWLRWQIRDQEIRKRCSSVCNRL